MTMPRRAEASDHYTGGAFAELAPAVCPGCGASVKTTLHHDPLTPVYLCNSTPDRLICISPKRLPLRTANLAVPSDRDLDELAAIVGAVLVAHAPYAPIGICEVYGCSDTSIGATCLRHG